MLFDEPSKGPEHARSVYWIGFKLACLGARLNSRHDHGHAQTNLYAHQEQAEEDQE